MNEPRAYRVRLDGGDGYCPFFRSPQILERVQEDWFPTVLTDWGTAILFRIVKGTYQDDYVALTAGHDPENWLLANGYLAGVAHHIRNPGANFRVGDADPCGKSYVELLKD